MIKNKKISGIKNWPEDRQARGEVAQEGRGVGKIRKALWLPGKERLEYGKNQRLAKT